MGLLEAVCSGCGPLKPCVEHVAAFDSSVGASLGSLSLMAMWAPVCQHVATWPGVGPTGPMILCDLILYISLSSKLRSIQMIYSFQSSRRARHTGAVQNWHLGLFMMMPYLCH
jgi:hypothetical protein